MTALFPRIIQPRGPTYVMPFGLTGGTAYLQGEAEADNPAEYESSTPTTANRTLTPKKLAVRFPYSEEMEEESIVPILPELRKSLARALGEGIEEAVISGDTTAAHMDTGRGIVSNDRRKAWDGLRHFCVSTLTTASKSLATYSGDTLLSIQTAMEQEYVNPVSDVVIIIPSKLRAKTYFLVDNSTNKTVVFMRNTEMGDRTLLTGQIGDFFGSPVISSAWIPTDLNASGIYNGTTTDYTALLVVNKRAWLLADRREVTIKLVDEPLKGRSNLVATWRGSFTHMFGDAAVTTGMGYYITP